MKKIKQKLEESMARGLMTAGILGSIIENSEVVGKVKAIVEPKFNELKRELAKWEHLSAQEEQLNNSYDKAMEIVERMDEQAAERERDRIEYSLEGTAMHYLANTHRNLSDEELAEFMKNVMQIECSTEYIQFMRVLLNRMFTAYTRPKEQEVAEGMSAADWISNHYVGGVELSELELVLVNAMVKNNRAINISTFELEQISTGAMNVAELEEFFEKHRLHEIMI